MNVHRFIYLFLLSPASCNHSPQANIEAVELSVDHLYVRYPPAIVYAFRAEGKSYFAWTYVSDALIVRLGFLEDRDPYLSSSNEVTEAGSSDIHERISRTFGTAGWAVFLVTKDQLSLLRNVASTETVEGYLGGTQIGLNRSKFRYISVHPALNLRDIGLRRVVTSGVSGYRWVRSFAGKPRLDGYLAIGTVTYYQGEENVEGLNILLEPYVGFDDR